MEDVTEEDIKVITSVGPDDHVISGGVDSTVAATLDHKAIGDKLHCIFVDNGLLRYKEQERVMGTFERDLYLPVTCVDASVQFLSELKGVTDPDKKRKIIGMEFISVFDAFSQDLEKKIGKKSTCLVQWTLRILDVPMAFLKRHQFPGPGLAVRIPSDVTQGNALDILRHVEDETLMTWF
ncbi:hypothetical protein L1987_81249 [Smallanthus sonchifolius]|uniref:Uncharacterized protein n=1 Tax=Smallanthus sonchifolius TaxID=185202 RepID=A0ACB8YQK2_9ASTR|nr:hypothetical protein L1987_81249 [Smallanthus sonchifolius]